MSLSRMSSAAWLLRRPNLGLPLLVLIAVMVALICVLLRWKVSIEGQADARQQQMELLLKGAPMVSMPDKNPVPALSPMGLAQLSNQVALLNRDWTSLLNAFVPRSEIQSDIKLLGMDVNPSTGSVRITGVATTPTMANTYAESLQQQPAKLHQVRLLVTERRPGGIHFEVSAQWKD